jgi:hypothetical protein
MQISQKNEKAKRRPLKHPHHALKAQGQQAGTAGLPKS